MSGDRGAHRILTTQGMIARNKAPANFSWELVVSGKSLPTAARVSRVRGPILTHTNIRLFV